MNNYSFAADFLNKFSQLTPWVQATLGVFICVMIAVCAYFAKETVRVIAERFGKTPQTRVVHLEKGEEYTGPLAGW